MRQNCYFHFEKISLLAVRSSQDPALSVTSCAQNRCNTQTNAVPNISRNELNSELYQKSWILCHSCNKYIYPFSRSHIHQRLIISEHTLQLESVFSLSHLEFCIHLWGPQDRKDVDLLEQVQRRATGMLRGLEHLFFEDRLREMVLFSLEKTRFRRDLTATFQYVKGACQKNEDRLFNWASSNRTRANGF